MRTYTYHGHDDKGNKLTDDITVHAESDKEFGEMIRPLLMTDSRIFYSVVGEGGDGLVSATYFPRGFSDFYV
jgi:hypothetical protein